jgi:hypothetical protein
MHLERRSSGLALAALAPFALSLSCGSSGSFPTGTGGGPSGGSGGMSGAAGTTAPGGTTGNAGTTSTGGASGVAGMTGTGGTTSTGGASGAAGTTGVAGSGGTTGTAGSAGEGGGNVGGGGASGAGAGRGGAGGGNAGSGAGGTGGAAGGGMMPTTGCGKAAGLMSGRASIDVAGKMREYILAVPSNYDMNKPYRLIFGWHPWGGSAQQIAQQGYFGLSSVINGQAILVAPEGQDFQDNGLGWGNANGEDIAFLHAMVDRFSAQLCIDQSRMFSTGFSFGAMFSFTLACTEMSMMRAIAPMAGNATTSGRCEAGTRSVATLAFIGVDDSLLSGHRSAVQIFVDRNDCSTQTTPVQPSWCEGLNANFLPCSCVQYQGCKAGYPVIECEYKAGHQFAPSAGSTLWNFFSQF